MDKKAKHILFQTYWSAKGWRDKPVTSQFAFMFRMSLTITVMNVYLSVLSEQIANWWHKLKIIVYELI